MRYRILGLAAVAVMLLAAAAAASLEPEAQERGRVHQHLAYQAGLQSPCGNGFQLFYIVHQAAAGSAHGISRTQNHRITQLFRNGYGFVYRIGYLAAGHLNAETVHGMLKLDPVFPPLNGIYLDADNLYIVLFQDAGFGKLRTKIKTGLSAEIRQ